MCVCLSACAFVCGMGCVCRGRADSHVVMSNK